MPAVLPDAEPVVLDVYGSLLYAGARTLGARLPDPRASKRPVVILRLRGRTSLGSTFFGVIAGYAEALEAAGGRLYLSGVQDDMVDRFHRSQVRGCAGQDQDLPRHRGARAHRPWRPWRMPEPGWWANTPSAPTRTRPDRSDRTRGTGSGAVLTLSTPARYSG